MVGILEKAIRGKKNVTQIHDLEKFGNSIAIWWRSKSGRTHENAAQSTAQINRTEALGGASIPTQIQC